MEKDSGGEPADAGRIIEKYSETVYRLACSMMKNRYDADDIFQEVFIRYLRNTPVFLNECHEKAWFLRVTVNCCKNHWKTAWTRLVTGLEERDKAETAGMEQESMELISAVKTLPAKYRAVIHLFYYEDLAIEEISRTLRIRPSTVRTQLTRARRLLKQRLEGF